MEKTQPQHYQNYLELMCQVSVWLMGVANTKNMATPYANTYGKLLNTIIIWYNGIEKTQPQSFKHYYLKLIYKVFGWLEWLTHRTCHLNGQTLIEAH